MSGMLEGLKKWAVGALLCITAIGNAYSAPKTVLVLGDSLSAEYGIVRGSGWVALLEQKLKDQKMDVVVINASISGETTSGGLARLSKLIELHRPSLVAIELGANDGLRGLPLAAAEANLNKMIDQSRQAKAKVLLIGNRLPPNYGSYAEQFYGVFGKVSRQAKVPLVPFMLDGVADKPQLFQPDRLHPLATAHPTILANIWPQLSAMIKQP